MLLGSNALKRGCFFYLFFFSTKTDCRPFLLSNFFFYIFRSTGSNKNNCATGKWVKKKIEFILCVNEQRSFVVVDITIYVLNRITIMFFVQWHQSHFQVPINKIPNIQSLQNIHRTKLKTICLYLQPSSDHGTLHIK